jgi:hypothetical protein
MRLTQSEPQLGGVASVETHWVLLEAGGEGIENPFP